MEDAFKILNSDLISNISFINFHEAYSMNEVFVVGNSVLARGQSDRKWVYLSSKSIKEFEILVTYLKEDDKCFAVIEEWMMPYIIDKSDILWQLSCSRFYCLDDVVLPENNIEIKRLKLEDAPYIFENYDYKDFTSLQYISERIEKGIALGIYNRNELAAWIMTHDDGAIGFLTVMKEYRRKGYGIELTVAMIKEIRKLGKIPFLYIEPSNEKSINLALKIGFTKDRMINWFERI